ncbi:Rieske (2Fe-2S) protein [Actinacidiphila sp. DG2A-62]|uniref:Rieske (2Fe-2S) protein n=1 Tax=Actinacidiphila sp. DG2A-62 TaxID=3108821 RepID=UPI002DC03D19|nr:Rieske (2Fe-2S) protein [Actinacidiphila sp. DG2A-62]MEC3998577.1 Rieske (2Fe-2S) protein [Actinacidiphila sp. DG2A-62]
MAENSGFPDSPTRRGVVAAAGGVGLAAVLAACGSDSDSDSDSDSKADSGADATPSGSSSDAGATPSASGPTDASGGGGGQALAKTTDIPVGGGKVFDAQKVVVTQPTAGQFKAFSAVCTHMGCSVSGVSDGVIVCPCHGSKFHVADGSVANGPATSPLPAKQVTVSGGEITLA